MEAPASRWWFKRHPVLGAVIGGLMLLGIILNAVNTFAEPENGYPATGTP